jgi:hypothetical protein
MTIPYAAFIRHERKQAERFALINARIEDLAGPDFILGAPHRDIVKLCDLKIEILKWMQDSGKDSRNHSLQGKRRTKQKR